MAISDRRRPGALMCNMCAVPAQENCHARRFGPAHRDGRRRSRMVSAVSGPATPRRRVSRAHNNSVGSDRVTPERVRVSDTRRTDVRHARFSPGAACQRALANSRLGCRHTDTINQFLNGICRLELLYSLARSLAIIVTSSIHR